MKGPRSRHKFYIARQWECPACKKRVLTDVRAVNRACTCQGADRPTWMTLVEEQRRTATRPPMAPEPPPQGPVASP